MIATTWVQIIKACLLLGGGTLVMLLAFSQFGFNFETLAQQAVAVSKSGMKLMGPGTLLDDPVTAVSLGLGLMFGTAGLPHILMRFFTVPMQGSAEERVRCHLLRRILLLRRLHDGLGGDRDRRAEPGLFEGGDINGKMIGGGNMPAMHLAQAVGGNVLLGFLAAVAFATILAVVAGLALAGAGLSPATSTPT